MLTDVIARAGGGGSSGGGSGSAGILVLPIVIISAIIAWWRRRKQVKKAQQALAKAMMADPTWDSAIERASQVFMQFEHDWSEFNVPSMQRYLTPQYFAHISLMMQALAQMNRQNQMQNVQLTRTTIFNVSDSTVDTQDNFDIEMQASASDKLLDLTTNEVLFTDAVGFTEVWHFDRENDEWLLEGIQQVDAETAIEKGYASKATKKAKNSEVAKMQSFAERNNFFYNADFGWLLLPTEGLLFTLANFGRSDINYHVIGQHHNVLVQFYQYVPITPDKRRLTDYFKSFYKPAYRHDSYVVAQTILPKTYGNIVVKRRSALGFSPVPRGMTPVSLEGVDFDKNFLVYATDVEKVTSLELLNPAYMEKLLAAPFKVSIEIVGNVLYLYSTDKTADFDTMLALLQNAFEEMRM